MSPLWPPQLPVKLPPRWYQLVSHVVIVKVRVLTQPVPVKLHMPEASCG